MTDPTRHRLILLRHAKSAWDQPNLVDHDRPLTPRGVRGARLIGHYMHAQSLLPALILCSSATRTRDTLELVESSWSHEHRPRVEITHDLYLCGIPALLTRVGKVSDDIHTMMIVAHNPDLADLAQSLLDDEDRDSEAGRALLTKFPTAALAVFDLAIAGWHALQPGTTGRLITFQTPKQLQA